MILKSMSRKEPSFGQLATYMSDEKSDRAFDLHQNVFSRDPADIAEEFDANAKHLGRRRGGNYLYHEILSIDTRLCGQGREVREKLRLLALEFIQKRCPQNMVYGAMHRDHGEHLHYHLMISANARGDKKRLRLTKADFDLAKREIELSARTNYPELKQDEIITASPKEKQERRKKNESRKAQEMKKRGARLTKTEALAQELSAILAYATSQAELERLLKEKGFIFYERGKHCGVRPIPSDGEKKRRKAYRFATLGIDAEYVGFLERVAAAEPPHVETGVEGEKEKQDDVEYILHSDAEESASEQDGVDPDNQAYVNNGSNADLNSQPTSQQDHETSTQTEDPFLTEMADRRAKSEAKAQELSQEQSRGPRRR